MTTDITILTITCAHENCGIQFFLAQGHVARLKEHHGTFYCPNGHAQNYPQKSDVEIKQQMIDIGRRRILELEEELARSKKPIKPRKKKKS